jgi:hypothetical protein
MTESNEELHSETGAHGGQYDEQLQQTNSEFRSGDAGDLGNDLRLAEEQEMIKHQAKGEFPNPEDEGENLEDVPPLDAEREAIDVPGEELHNTDEADASDDPYNLGGQDT